MIASTFFDLGEYSISAIDRAVPSPKSASPSLSPSSGTNSPTLTPSELPFYRTYTASAPVPEVTPSTRDLDTLLPSVCEALVLMSQCLITFALTSEDEEFLFPPGDNPKDFLNAAMVEEGVGVPEITISAFQSVHLVKQGASYPSTRSLAKVR